MKNETICNSTTLTAASFGYATKASKETMRGRNISNSNIKTIEIIDIMGKIVMQKSLNNLTGLSLDVSELQKSIYIIKAINAQGNILISKFIKE